MFIIWLLVALVGTFALGLAFRFAGQSATGNAPYFRDMSPGVAFGFALAAFSIGWVAWTYFSNFTLWRAGDPTVNKLFFFYAAVHGIFLAVLMAFYVRELGRYFGSEESKKMFRQMPLTAAFGIGIIILYAFVSVFAGQTSLITILIIAFIGIVIVQTAQRNLTTDSARALTSEEQQALLEPWFGPDLPLDSLPVPQLIEVIAGNPGYDASGLRLRLSGEVPGAVLDDHSRARDPLVQAAASLRRLGLISVLLITAATAAMITLAAQSALSANTQVIRVMRLVGATDVYIARAFVRRFTIRTLLGATIGILLGIIGLIVLSTLPDRHEQRSRAQRINADITQPPDNYSVAFTCFGCGYTLNGVTTGGCPECGRPFDPANLATVMVNDRAMDNKPPWTSRWSLICGILGFATFCIPVIGMIIPGLGVLFGHLALDTIKKRPKKTDRGVAIAGLVITGADISGKRSRKNSAKHRE